MSINLWPSAEVQKAIVRIAARKAAIEALGLTPVNITISRHLWGPQTDRIMVVLGLPVVLDDTAPSDFIAVGVKA